MDERSTDGGSGLMARSEPVMRDGDIYFWRWKEGMEPQLLGSTSYRYHCRSQKAVVVNGRLLDTFWGDHSSDRAIDPARLELRYMGNESELRKISEHEIPYYEENDIVDMRHSNSSRETVYVQPDAKRSKRRILEHLEYKRDRAKRDIEWATNAIERLDEAIGRVNGGDVGGYFP